MKSKQIDFYFFSGTGNTRLVVDEMTTYFQNNNISVQLFPIEKKNEIATDHMIGLAFPVAMFSTYQFIWDFLKSIPETNQDTEVFMVDTLAAISGGIVSPLYFLLKKKGYKPVAAKEIIMPSNWNKKENSEVKDKKIVEKGLKQARQYAHDILYGIGKWKHIPLPNLLSKFSLSDKPWQSMRKKFSLRIDANKCIKCGICYRLCPIENITMEHFPEFSDRCQLCMRCINFCPTNAISFENKKTRYYKAVTNEKQLNGG